MEKQWIENLRKRFDDRKTPVPDGLWSDIEAAMNAKVGQAAEKNEPAKALRVVPLWQKRAVAAAACVIIAGGAGLMLMQRSDKEMTTNEKTYVKATAAESTENAVAEANTEPTAGNITAAVSRAVKERFAANVKHAEAMSEDVSRMINEEKVTAQTEESKESSDRLAQKTEQQSTHTQQDRHVRNKIYEENAKLMAASSHEKKGGRGMNFSVYGSSLTAIGGATNGSNDIYSPLRMQEYTALNNDMLLLSSIAQDAGNGGESGNEVRVRHRQPLKLGASLRFRLNNRLALETGIMYSYHSSDIASGDEKSGYKTNQKLHFAGIPLSLSCNLWRNDFLEVYAKGGGAVEFCISGTSDTDYISGSTVTRTETESVRDTHPQWSVNAAAGVQYNFIDRLGVYVEPGVSYYIDNGGTVSTIYRDKPLNFNLNLGLRFTIE